MTDISLISAQRNCSPHLNSLLLSGFNSRSSRFLCFFLPLDRLLLLFCQLRGLFCCFGLFFSFQLFFLLLPCSFFCFSFSLFDLCLLFLRQRLFLDWSVEMASRCSELVQLLGGDETYTWAGTPLSHHNSLPTAAAFPIGYGQGKSRFNLEVKKVLG